MVKIAVALVSMVLVALVPVGVSATAGPTKLLPDLDPVAPLAIQPLAATDGSGKVYLTFTFAFDNKGAGPLILHGHRADTDSASMVADQMIKTSSRAKVTRPNVGKIRWLPNKGYTRWGFQHQSYALHSPNGGTRKPVNLIGLCLEDNRKAPRFSSPQEPDKKAFQGRCGRNKPDLLAIDLGLSVGWRNVHLAKREGQLIDITKAPAGEYVLVVRANAAGALQESSTTNNAASARISITWAAGHKLPKLEVIATCDDSATCS